VLAAMGQQICGRKHTNFPATNTSLLGKPGGNQKRGKKGVNSRARPAKRRRSPEKVCSSENGVMSRAKGRRDARVFGGKKNISE